MMGAKSLMVFGIEGVGSRERLRINDRKVSSVKVGREMMIDGMEIEG